MKLVGFSGRKQSGKDSAIDFLRNVHRDCGPIVRYAFGDKLKDICMEMFGLTSDQCYGTDQQKNTFTEILWQDMPHYELLVNPRTGPMTAREFMQVFGSDIMRKIFNNVWVKALMFHIDEVETGWYGDIIPSYGFIADVRFPNEVKAIHDRGGKVYRFTRNIDPNDTHKSETELDNYEGWDGVINNQELSLEQKNKAVLQVLMNDGVLPKLLRQPCL